MAKVVAAAVGRFMHKPREARSARKTLIRGSVALFR